MLCCRNCVMYVCQLSVLIWASFIHFKERLPEAICCCLQTCKDVVLVVMYCMYIPAFIVSSADIRQLWHTCQPYQYTTGKQSVLLAYRKIYRISVASVSGLRPSPLRRYYCYAAARGRKTRSKRGVALPRYSTPCRRTLAA